MQTWQILAQGDGGEGIAILAGGMFLVWLILIVAALGVWIYALVDAIKNPALESNERLIWILVILLANWVGALIYLFAGRKRKR
jgi:hypothetical protein